MLNNPFAALALCLCIAVAVGCGSDGPEEESAGNLTPMAAPASANAAERNDGELPRVTQVRFEPDPPVPGRTVRAIVDLEDGARASLHYVWSLNGREIAKGGDEIDLPDADKNAKLELEVTPQLGDRFGQPYSSTVRLGNRDPHIAGVSFQPPTGLGAGAEVTARPLVDEPDGDSLRHRYQWYVNGQVQREVSPTFSTEGLRRGDRVHVEVSTNDGHGWTPWHRSEVIVLVNAAPKLRSTPLVMGEDGVLRTRIEAEDPDGDRGLRFELTEGPEGLDLDPMTGDVAWKPRPEQAGVFRVKIAVADPRGATARTEFDLTLGAPGEAGAPAAPQP